MKALQLNINMSTQWYRSNVFKGQQLGRTIGFPTANLDQKILPDDTKPGVYASWVRIGNDIYKGALYYGPRLVLDETHTVLEIYVLHFPTTNSLYDIEIEFTLENFIRAPANFVSFDLLKNQLDADCLQVEQALTNLA